MDQKFIPDPSCPVPTFIAAADKALDHLKDHFALDHPAAMCFFGQKFIKDNQPYEYHRCAAFGDDEFVVTTMSECFSMQPQAYKLITRAWYHHFLSVTKANDPDMAIREARRAILRLMNKNERGEERTVDDEAADLFRLVERDTPALDAQINVLRSKAKIFRRQGLHQMQLLIEQRIAALTDQLIQERDDADRLELQSDQRRANALEALRVRRQRQEETALDHRLQHDYDSMTRRVRSYRTMIDRLTREMEALQEEQRQMQQQHPQFDPHSAAKQKLRQMAERKRERAAHKKKGKEQMQDNIGSCSQMLRKIG